MKNLERKTGAWEKRKEGKPFPNKQQRVTEKTANQKKKIT